MTRRESIRTGLTVLAILSAILGVMIFGVRTQDRLPVLLEQIEQGKAAG